METNQQFQTDTYILKGGAQQEVYASRFTYHGFQYVEVTGFPGRPNAGQPARPVRPLRRPGGRRVHLLEPAAEPDLARRPLGLPQQPAGHPDRLPAPREERLDRRRPPRRRAGPVQLRSGPGHTKWINDLGDEQQPTGELPGIVPTSGWGYNWGNGPAWDSAFLLIPYYEYLYCGDTENFRRHYDGMKRYVDYLTAPAPRTASSTSA